MNMDGKGKVIPKTLKVKQKLGFNGVKSNTCAHSFIVENSIIKEVLKCIIKKYSAEVEMK